MSSMDMMEKAEDAVKTPPPQKAVPKTAQAVNAQGLDPKLLEKIAPYKARIEAENIEVIMFVGGRYSARAVEVDLSEIADAIKASV